MNRCENNNNKKTDWLTDWLIVWVLNSLVRPSQLIWGSNFSDVTSLRSSGLRLHTLTPSAAPAAMAAPSAVVSGMDGFTGHKVVTLVVVFFFTCSIATWTDSYSLRRSSPTGMQRMSACSCISSRLDVIPPSTCSWVSGMPLSWFMASRICKQEKLLCNFISKIPISSFFFYRTE